MESFNEEAFTQQVNGAFKNYHSILALSRSPLANAQLIAPALVRDAVSPTADERGHGLRLALQWAVAQLAPEPPRQPLGVERSYADPTWRDSRWWLYNILRHRYLEPLHPDEFVEGGRYTETLIALTGIPSADSFFEERNRAVREAAAWLRQHQQSGAATTALRQMALEETLRLLQSQPAAQALLAIAATFDEVFPRELLLAIASDEHIAGAETALTYLTSNRLLLTDDRGADLVLSPVLRAYVYERQSEERRQRRHAHAARHYAAIGDPLQAAEHWQRAAQWAAAARALFAAAPELISELRLEELCEVLARFQPNHLNNEDWRETQVLLSDLLQRLGRREEALAACRRALKATSDASTQARIYRRMGKLYEQQNQLHALGYYRQAEERFVASDPELVTLLKDRAWLHILRREWQQAGSDLDQALRSANPGDHEIKADILDALANLSRHQHNLAQAVEFAQQALALREEIGHLPRIADSFNNLGLLYSAIADHSHALAAFQEALAIYRQIDNRERTAMVLLNSGMAHHLAGRLPEAVEAYRECLTICASDGLVLTQVRVLYNLAEALAELGATEAADYWATGHRLAVEAAFDDEVRDLHLLRDRFPHLLGEPQRPITVPTEQADLPLVTQHDADEQQIFDLIARDGQVTPKSLMAATAISKATATRRLADMARKGILRQQGQGRATAYIAGHPGQPKSEGSAHPATQEIERLEQRLREATLANDIALHEALLADNWLNTNANGTTTSKAQLINLLREQPFAFIAINDEEVAIETYSETALVRGRSIRQRQGPDGTPITQTVRFSRLYARINGQWQIVHAQSTPIRDE
jgi:tetratricopeptide (TPR) repeat protein